MISRPQKKRRRLVAPALLALLIVSWCGCAVRFRGVEVFSWDPAADVWIVHPHGQTNSPPFLQLRAP